MPGTTAPPAVEVAAALVVAVGRLRRRLREVATVDDLSPSATSALDRIAKGEARTVSELAVRERVRPQSMAATVEALLDRGLVQRRPDPEDGRRRLLAVTDLGADRAGSHRRALHAWLAQAVDERLTAAERDALLKAAALLDRLASV